VSTKVKSYSCKCKKVFKKFVLYEGLSQSQKEVCKSAGFVSVENRFLRKNYIFFFEAV